MKFGVFYELQLPRPWGPDDEFRLYQNAHDQLELADRLGYDYAWKAKVLAREIELEEVDTEPFKIRDGVKAVELAPASA